MSGASSETPSNVPTRSGRDGRRLSYALTAMLIVLGGCSGGSGESTASPQPAATTSGGSAAAAFEAVMDVPYDDINALDVYMPTDDRADRPVVLIFSGLFGQRGGYEEMTDALVAEGIVVAVASWDGMANPTLEQFAGGACAVRYLRGNAVTYGIDPERITIAGHSRNAAFAAPIALGGDHFSDAMCETTGVSALPSGFLGLAGSYDPQYHPGDGRAYLLTTDPDLYAALNPVTYIGENPDLHVRLVHGSADDQVPVESSEAFDKVLRQAGYRVKLTVIDGAGHASLIGSSFDAYQVTIAEALALAGS